jgi:membrane-associated phospholipid phosphatase
VNLPHPPSIALLRALSHRASLALAALAFAVPALLAPTAPAAAQEARMQAAVVQPVSELALGLGVAPAAPSVALLSPPAAVDGHWRGGILFDESFRAAIRLSAVADQEVARNLSDALLLTTLVSAAADVLATPLARGDGELAWRASLGHVLSLGVTMGLGEIVKRTASRARPFERDCAADPERHGCSDRDVFQSFYSLHTGVAFTSAGFVCSSRFGRGLSGGDDAADAVACGTSLALAAATGLLRIVSDRHYLSDVLVGALLGGLVGVLVPLAILPERSQDAGAVTPRALEATPPAPIGLSFSGRF